MTFNTIVKKADISNSEEPSHHCWYNELTSFSAACAATMQWPKPEPDTQWLPKPQEFFVPPLVVCCRQQPTGFLK